MMKVYTFYDSSPEAPPDQSEFIRLWELSWRRRGWKTKILTEREAVQSPHYTTAKIRAQQFCVPLDFRFLKWLAFQTAGGGHLCDYRVINFSFKPKREKIDVKQVDLGVYWATKKGVNAFVADILTPVWIGFLAESSKIPQFALFDGIPADHDSKLKRFVNAADVLADGRPI